MRHVHAQCMELRVTLPGRSKLVHVNRAKDDRRFLPVTLINLQFMAKQAR